MDATARSIDGGSPTRTSIYHALPQAPLLHIHPVCDLFFYVVEFSNLQKIGILETLPYNLHAWILFAAWFRSDEILLGDEMQDFTLKRRRFVEMWAEHVGTCVVSNLQKSRVLTRG